MIRKQFVAEIRAVGQGARRRKFILSTANPDRDNDTVALSGWRLDNYKKNPVVLWAHDYRSLPLGKAVDVGIEGGRLVATAEFATHEFASTVLDLIDGGFLRATSVGFKPTRSKPNDLGGLDFLEQELLEFSVVPVPANPEALQLLRAKGLLGRADAEPVLYLADEADDDGLIDLAEVAAALPQALAGLAGDLAARRAATHTDRLDLTRGDVTRALRDATRDALADVVRTETRRAINRLTGRVD